jgi:excisionase family DNA binding protein
MNDAVENVFTVRELAQYLRMKPLTIYKHASAGKLPGFKVGSHWRFKKKTIDQWIEGQENTNTSRNSLVNS